MAPPFVPIVPLPNPDLPTVRFVPSLVLVMRLLRPLCLAGLMAAVAPTPLLHAADVDAEDYRQLKSRVAAFDEALAVYRTSIQSLRDELIRLRSENAALRTQANAARNAVSQEQLSRLAQQVQEVERNRTHDKQQVLDALDHLKTLAPVPARTLPKAPPKKQPKTVAKKVVPPPQ